MNELFGSNKIEYVFQRPSSPSRPISGVVFLAHGCSHSATDWWPKSESCLTCLGLPVEVSIVKEAVRRNYFVVAMSSSDSTHKCWAENDLDRAGALINFLYKKYLNADMTLPLYLLGGSSGGAFAAMLASAQSIHARVSALCVQIMGVHDLSNLPPTLFVLMSKDEQTMRQVKNKLHNHKLDVKGISRHKLMSVGEIKITPTFFHDHNEVLTMTDSETLHQAFVKNGVISSATQLLQKDPRDPYSNWREVILNNTMKKWFSNIYCSFIFSFCVTIYT